MSRSFATAIHLKLRGWMEETLVATVNTKSVVNLDRLVRDKSSFALSLIS